MEIMVRGPLLLLLALGAGCASKDAVRTSTVQRTKIDYDSTRDGPRMLPAAPEAPGSPAAANAKKCVHSWESVRDGTHMYLDTGSDPPLPTLCTPMVCTKCGLVRHECEWRRKR